MPTRMTSWLPAIALGMHMPAAWPAAAQSKDTYPTQSIRLIVPFESGSTADTVGRLLAQRLSARLKQEVAIDNRAGEDGAAGTAVAARAKPDGYTATIGSMTTHVFAPLIRKVTYDPLTDFDPVTAVAIVPYVLALSPVVSAVSLKEFIAHAKAQPRGVSYSSASDLVGHAAMEMLNNVSGANVTRVSLHGSTSMADPLVTGKVHALFASLPAVLPYVTSGAVRPVAVSTADRTAALPDTPTIAESGYPGFEVVDWFAVFVPRGTPARIISRLHVATARASSSSDMESQVARTGIESRTSISNIRVLQRIRADIKKYSVIVKSIGLEQQSIRP